MSLVVTSWCLPPPFLSASSSNLQFPSNRISWVRLIKKTWFFWPVQHFVARVFWLHIIIWWVSKLVWLSPWWALMLLLLQNHLHWNFLFFCFSSFFVLVQAGFSWWCVLTLVCNVIWSNFIFVSVGLCQHLSVLEWLIFVQFLLCWNWLGVSLDKTPVCSGLRWPPFTLVELNREQTTTLGPLGTWTMIGSWCIRVLVWSANHVL